MRWQIPQAKIIQSQNRMLNNKYRKPANFEQILRSKPNGVRIWQIKVGPDFSFQI